MRSYMVGRTEISHIWGHEIITDFSSPGTQLPLGRVRRKQKTRFY